MSWDIYDCLVEHAHVRDPVRRVLLGLSWSVAELAEPARSGLSFSPVAPPRTLPFAGKLAGQPTSELASWVRSFDPCEAAVGCAVVNAAVNGPANSCLGRAQPLAGDAPAHLRVFEAMSDKLADANVVVVGLYPGLTELWQGRKYTCLERFPAPGTLPDTAAEYLLPQADWVFLTGSALANKTLPRLLELSRSARVVLMGPSVPWLDEWAEFGVDYLAGVAVRDQDRLWQVASEGGGTRIFEEAVEYRLLSFS